MHRDRIVFSINGATTIRCPQAKNKNKNEPRHPGQLSQKLTKIKMDHRHICKMLTYWKKNTHEKF